MTSSATAPVDMSGMVAVTGIGSGFLYSCTSLTTVDMSGMVAVTGIGHSFLYSCPSLTTVDMSGMVAVTEIDAYSFRWGVRLPDEWVGEGMLGFCNSAGGEVGVCLIKNKTPQS